MSVRATVVVPYFEGQHLLDLLLSALELQTLGPERFEVVVADDGSRRAPEVGRRPFPVRVVRQADLGCRPGAARNLGARGAAGAVLVFLDGDMVPEPRYLEEMLQACDGQRLTIGRRRHTELADIDPAGLRRWLASGAEPDPVLPEPGWLTDAYAATDDLRRSDLRSYRYVIGAVIACPRELFERVGGFAEEIDGYGGEDWEFGRRCWLAGAELVHAPRAIAWHDGADLAGRPAARSIKNGETLRTAELLTDPHLRGHGLWWSYPRVVVRCGFPREATEAARVACVESLLAGGDVGVWLGGGVALPLPDPRIRTGMPGAAVLGRCELVIDLAVPVVADPATVHEWQRLGPARNDAVAVRSPRDAAIQAPWAELPAVEVVPDDVALEGWFGARAARREG